MWLHKEKLLRKPRKNLQEAVELYLEDVLEAGDEQEFIPRPASMELLVTGWPADLLKNDAKKLQ